MDKPIIFFSHSSYDEKALRKLKDLLISKTGNTVQIFLSSDGQSIPLGRNWVSKLEEAMKQSRIMLVFLSPMSLQSHWIYFEAGYAYRQETQVIPLGILGVNLEQVGPPLGLLQGFNIKSEDGLNNIIALINEKFDHSHEESFTKEEFDEIFVGDQMFGKGALGKYAFMVDRIEIDLPFDANLAFDRIPKLFDDASIVYQVWRERQQIHAAGLSFVPLSEKDISARLDPSLTELTLGILDDVIKNLRKEQPDSYTFRVIFTQWVNACTVMQKLTARLYRTDIVLGKEGYLVFDGIVFRIRPAHHWHDSNGRKQLYPVALDIEYHDKTLSDIRLYDLLDILFERGVLYAQE